MDSDTSLRAPPNDSIGGSAGVDDAAGDAAVASETTRTFVTLALLFHLFLAVLGILEAMPAQSELVTRLHNKLFETLVYPELLLMRSYAFSLTYNIQSGWEAEATLVLDWEPGDETSPARLAQRETVSLADYESLKLPMRRQRYLALADRLAGMAEGQDPNADLVPSFVARRLLVERYGDLKLAAGNYRLRIRRIPAPQPDYSRELDGAPETPDPIIVLDANLAVRGGKLTLARAAAIGLSAPVDPRPLPSDLTSPPTKPNADATSE
jgi:hypothetical protein